MTLRVTRYGEEILHQPGEPVTVFDAPLKALAQNMIETMYAADGIGLAAQQVGQAIQLCVIDVREEPGHVKFEYQLDGRKPPLDLIMPMALVNPVVEPLEKELIPYEEGCLSFPGLTGETWRPGPVRCQFRDLDGHPHVIEADGLLGRCIQHEVDHLNGVLFIDRMKKPEVEKLLPALRKLQKATRKEMSV